MAWYFPSSSTWSVLHQIPGSIDCKPQWKIFHSSEKGALTSWAHPVSGCLMWHAWREGFFPSYRISETCWSVFNYKGVFAKISSDAAVTTRSVWPQAKTAREHHSPPLFKYYQTSFEAICKSLLSICVDLLPLRVEILRLSRVRSAIWKSFENLVHNYLEPHRLQLHVDACLCHTSVRPVGTLL